MFKIYSGTDALPTYVISLIHEGYYKVILRENIIIEGNQRKCNEYITFISADVDDDPEQYVVTNFDLLLQSAKLNEKLEDNGKQIRSLKKSLDNSDYKLLKCMESFMLSDVLPYDFSQLLSDRTLLRDKINLIQEGVESDTLDKLKDRKIIEMSAISNMKITDGVDYNNEHFRLTMNDQISLTTLGSLAQSGQSVPYHADGKVCRIFTSTEMLGLIQAASQYIVYHKTYFNLLKHQILNMTDAEEIKSVTYGMELSEEYQKILIGITGDNNEENSI